MSSSCWAFCITSADLVPWLLASAALIGSIAVSYVRAKDASFGVATAIGFMQRQERAP